MPDDVTPDQLAPRLRKELRSLPKDLADRVARHLVMAGRLVADDPAAGYRHAKTARRLASRIGVVRGECGISAYRAGEWADALAELRAARRLTGSDAYLPMMADAERGLGRPRRAVELAGEARTDRMETAERIELAIVVSGARRDLGQHEAAVLAVQLPELRDRGRRPWTVRLGYAYAEALLAAGRTAEARAWFARTARADTDEETDAALRAADPQGAAGQAVPEPEIVDFDEDEDEDDSAERA